MALANGMIDKHASGGERRAVKKGRARLSRRAWARLVARGGAALEQAGGPLPFAGWAS
jgi:hypothetical protein